MAIGYLDSQYLTDIADAIREKDGTQGTYTPSQMPNAIRNIPGPEVQPKDVTFYDWDGTILYTYTKEQIQNLTSLPPLPADYKDYHADSWTETLETLKKCKTSWNVGVNYTTSRTTTKVYISIDETRLQVQAYQSPVSWGDGSSGGTLHTYTEPGNYVMEFNSSHLQGSISYALVWAVIDARRVNNKAWPNPIVKEIHFGNQTSIDNYIISGCLNPKVLIPKGCVMYASNSNYLFMGGNMTFISFPSDFLMRNTMIIYGMYELEEYVIPSSLWNGGISRLDMLPVCNVKYPPQISSTTIGSGQWVYWQPNAKIVEWALPEGITDIAQSFSTTVKMLKVLILPSSLTHLPPQAFYNLDLDVVTLPEGLTSIGRANTGTYLFNSIGELHMKPTTPPVLLQGTNAQLASYGPAVIYVPAESVEAYKLAWSQYESIIQAEPTT